jgi:hypothetical protein
VEALIGQVAEQFIDQIARGEQPNIEEYVGRYPAIASVLRQALASLQLIRVPVLEDGTMPGTFTWEGILGLSDFCRSGTFTGTLIAAEGL